MNKVLSILLLCAVNSSALAVLVHDPISYAKALEQLRQMATHYRAEVEQWQQQISHFKEQNNLMKEQLASTTGLRELGDLGGELLTLAQELAGIEKHREALNACLRSPSSEQHEYADEILSKYQMFNICKKKGNKKLENMCREHILNKAGTIEVGEEIRQQMVRKIVETSKIALRAKKTKDIKESQDLANLIALKDIEIKQLKNQWDSFVDESNLREKLIEEKRQEAFHEHQMNAPSPNIEFK